MSDSMTDTTDQPPKTGQVAADAAGQVATQATDQARNVTETAKEQTKAVVQTAQEQVRTVGSDVQQHARRVLGDTGREVETQLDQRVRQLTQTARSSGDELRALAEGRTDEAGRMGEFATQAAQRLANWSDRAEELGPRGLADEAAKFARRRPGTFLAGAAVAGFLAGRVLRNAGSGSDGSDANQLGGARGQLGAGSRYDPTPPNLGAGSPTLPGVTPEYPGQGDVIGEATPPLGAGLGTPGSSPGGVG